MDLKLILIWGAGAAGAVFVLWQLWVLVMWSVEKKFFYRGVNDFRERQKKGFDSHKEINKKPD